MPLTPALTPKLALAPAATVSYMNCINLILTFANLSCTPLNECPIVLWPERVRLIMQHVSRDRSCIHFSELWSSLYNCWWIRQRVIRRESEGNNRGAADLVMTVRSFLRLSAPGFSFWTSPFFGTVFFCFLWRTALMVSAQCLGCSWGVIRWKEVDLVFAVLHSQRRKWEHFNHIFLKRLEIQDWINYHYQHIKSVLSSYTNPHVLFSASSHWCQTVTCDHFWMWSWQNKPVLDNLLSLRAWIQTEPDRWGCSAPHIYPTQRCWSAWLSAPGRSHTNADSSSPLHPST